MIINIIDINEENPHFNSTFSIAQLTENSAGGTFVAQVAAVKTSISSRLTYSFTNGLNSNFKIDEITVCVSQIYFMQVLLIRFRSTILYFTFKSVV